jgi:uncharacterized protein (TIGR03435 family)
MSLKLSISAVVFPAWLQPKADFDQLRLMLRSLLEDRFRLKVHRETRTTAVYALVVDKNGPRIKLLI